MYIFRCVYEYKYIYIFFYWYVCLIYSQWRIWLIIRIQYHIINAIWYLLDCQATNQLEDPSDDPSNQQSHPPTTRSKLRDLYGFLTKNNKKQHIISTQSKMRRESMPHSKVNQNSETSFYEAKFDPSPSVRPTDKPPNTKKKNEPFPPVLELVSPHHHRTGLPQQKSSMQIGRRNPFKEFEFSHAVTFRNFWQ